MNGRMSRAQLRTDDPVAETARGLLDELAPVLEESCPGEDDKRLELPGTFSRWVPAEQLAPGIRNYRAIPRVLTVEQQCAARILSEMFAAGAPMLDGLTQAIGRDPTIGPRIDHAVISTGAGGGTWQTQGLVQLLIDGAIEQAGGFDLDPAQRDVWVSQWLAALRRRSDVLIVIVALSEFRAEQVPIVLEEGVEIDELSDAEISAALALGGRASFFAGDSQMISRTFGIRTSFETPLFVDDIPPAEGTRDQAAREDAHGRAGLVLLALRVFKAGRVGTAGTFQYSAPAPAEIASMSGSLNRSFGWPVAEPYVLTSDEASAFREFWTAFHSAHRHRVIEGALRRFGYAAERTRSDDEIVDLLIAAESLFLSDLDARDRGELRFRLSTRCALLLGETLDERRRIAKFMRHAYSARSGIVHGGVPHDVDLRTIEGERASVEEFADGLEEVLRRALQAAVTRIRTGQGFPPDWEELWFSGPTRAG
jgi:hypothetical protein